MASISIRGILTFGLLVFIEMRISVCSDTSSFVYVPYCLNRSPMSVTVQKDEKYPHCLNDEMNNSVVVFKIWEWIPKGECAFYNKPANRIDYRKCDGGSGKCPTQPYNSFETQMYSACYKNDSKLALYQEAKSINAQEQTGWKISSIVLTVVVILFAIIVVVVVCYKYKDWIWTQVCRRGRGPRNNSDVSRQKDADVPMLLGMEEREPGTNSGRKSKKNERRVDQPGQPQGAGNHPSPKYEIPSWCLCHRCREMETTLENLCCLKQPDQCRSLSHDFREHVLDRAMKEAGLSDEENKKIRQKAYELYTTYYVIDAGPSDKIPVPSCCMWKVRELHPDSEEKYMGYKG